MSERKVLLADQGIAWRIILKWILKECEGMDWVRLAHCRVQWQALVNTVMNLWFPYKAGS
jgi:hypothetical protein